MKLIVRDIYATEVSLQLSNSGYVRFDFKNDTHFPERKHPSTGENIPNCLSFNLNEAKAMLSVMQALIEEIERRER